MTPIQKLIDERLKDKSIEEVSQLYFPKYQSEKDIEAAEAALEEALTLHDTPVCMSHCHEY